MSSRVLIYLQLVILAVNVTYATLNQMGRTSLYAYSLDQSPMKQELQILRETLSQQSKSISTATANLQRTFSEKVGEVECKAQLRDLRSKLQPNLVESHTGYEDSDTYDDALSTDHFDEYYAYEDEANGMERYLLLPTERDTLEVICTDATQIKDLRGYLSWKERFEQVEDLVKQRLATDHRVVTVPGHTYFTIGQYQCDSPGQGEGLEEDY